MCNWLFFSNILFCIIVSFHNFSSKSMNFQEKVHIKMAEFLRMAKHKWCKTMMSNHLRKSSLHLLWWRCIPYFVNLMHLYATYLNPILAPLKSVNMNLHPFTSFEMIWNLETRDNRIRKDSNAWKWYLNIRFKIWNDIINACYWEACVFYFMWIAILEMNIFFVYLVRHQIS